MVRETVHLLLTALSVAAVVGGPAELQAQSPGDDQTEDLIESFDSPSGQSDTEGLPEASVSRINLDLDLRHWREALSSKKGDERLHQLVVDARGFGYENAPAYATAVGRAVASTDGLSAGRARDAFDGAQRLAADLPYPYLAETRFLADEHPSELEPIVATYAEALQRATLWPSTGMLLAAFGLIALVAGLAGGLGVVLVGQTLRHLPLAAHDLARPLPDVVSRGQILAALVLGVIAAILWTHSPLIGLLGILAFVSLSQDWRERSVAIAAVLFLAALPFAERQVMRLAALPGSDSQALLEAQYLRCGGDCRENLDDRFADRGDDPTVRFTRALALVRTGAADDIDRELELLEAPGSAPEPLRGHFHNLRGAALLADGRADDAIEQFQRATVHLEAPAAGWFNLMRAARSAGRDELASKASSEASARDTAAVQRQSEMQRKDPASHLMLPPLPLTHFWNRHLEGTAGGIDTASAGVPQTVLSEAWGYLAGPDRPLDDATHLGVGAAAALLVLSVFSMLGYTSSPCPNCGLAREPDDPEQTGGHPHCLPCYRTFVGGAELGYRARVHYETLLGRRSTTQEVLRRSLSVLLPGAGHALAGRVFAGFILGGTLAFGLFVGVYPDLLWQPPRSLAGPDFLGLHWLGWGMVGCAGIVALWSGYRDIVPVDPPTNQDQGGTR
jgi:hypothetical protein